MARAITRHLRSSLKPETRFSLVYYDMAILGNLTGICLGAVNEIRYVNDSGLHFFDWVVIALYASVVLGQGWYYSSGQKGSNEFFVASNKHLGSLSIGISLFATLLSTISYLGKPGEMISKGPTFIFAQIISVPFVYYIVAYVFLPTIMKKRVTSVYEFLEDKVGLVGRLCGAVLFIFLRLVWMALMIFLTSMALAVVTGLDLRWIGLISLFVGTISIAYSTMGGIRAVVKTDVLQATMLFVGAVATIGIVTWHCRGFSWIPSQWQPNWDNQPFISLDPYVRISMVGSLVHLTLWRVATYCSDQTAVQRFMTLKDLKSAQRSVWVTSIATVLSTLILAMVGFALLGFFKEFESALPSNMNLYENADQIFPFFIAHYLPVGISGFVVAAFLAAAMSSVDSGVSAITAVINTDFIQRLGKGGKVESGGIFKVRIVAALIGIIAIMLSFVVKYIPGNFLEIVNKSANLVTVPIFSLFIMAWFFPRVTPLGALLGTVSGLLIGFLVGFWDVLTGGPRISFLYMGVASLAFGLFVGWFFSRFGPLREQIKENWIWGIAGLILQLLLTTLLVLFGKSLYV